MVAWSHYIHPSEVKRGDHLYALRVLGSYQHHGIAITGTDAKCIDKGLTCVEEIMVIEQNSVGLRIVTLEKFSYECKGSIKWTHKLRRVQYNENPLAYEIKRRGSCYIEKALPVELIVDNAIKIFINQKEKWSPYSLLTRNCEHFAFVCSTGIGLLSEQILAKYDILSNTLSCIASTGFSIFFGICKNLLKNVVRIGEKMIPSSVANLTITSLDELFKSCVKGSAITAAIALAVEVSILTARWIAYLCVRENEEKLENRLATGLAITTRTYVKCLIKAVVSNGASFGCSLAGAMVGAFIPLPGAVIGFSIFFGFIGYVISRAGSGALINWLERLIDEKKEKMQLLFD